MTTKLDNLRRLGRLPARNVVFACGGTTEMDNVQLAYRPVSEDSAPPEWMSFPGASAEELQTLQNACTPSRFGRGALEVMDPTYRHASELPASRFLTSFELAATPILEQIHAVLMPKATTIHATMYKLNVYGPGGFFKAHKDTPRRANMFGTLVVCLPTEFTGGDFVVRHNTFSETFSWATSMARAQDTTPAIQWCAFYSDCEHEILPVVTGTRVTITFNLETWTTPVIKDLEVHSPFADQLAALADPAFAPHGTILGFALAHEYPVDGSSDVPLVKGVDRALAYALARAGLEYAFVPVYESDMYKPAEFPRAIVPGDSEVDDLDRYADVPEWSNDGKWAPLPVAAMDAGGVWAGDGDMSLFVSDWKNYAAILDSPADGDDSAYLAINALELRTAKRVVWIVPPRAFPFTKYGASYGNEPLMSAYYAVACLFARVPPASARGLVGDDESM